MKIKDIPGYEGRYAISKNGEVYSYPKPSNNNLNGKYLKPVKDKDGYLKVHLVKNSIKKYCFVHRLVAITFLDKKSGFNIINHKNGVKDDNRLGNLEWVNHMLNAHKKQKMNNKKYSSKFKGVTFIKNNKTNPWGVRITIKGKTKDFGSYPNEITAKKVADKVYLKLYGKHAILNEVSL